MLRNTFPEAPDGRVTALTETTVFTDDRISDFVLGTVATQKPVYLWEIDQQSDLVAPLLELKTEAGRVVATIELVDAGIRHPFNATCSPEVAAQLAPFMGQEIRLHGPGKWGRTADGVWDLIAFEITSWFVFDHTKTLSDVVAELRQIRSGWRDIAEPFKALSDLRDD